MHLYSNTRCLNVCEVELLFSGFSMVVGNINFLNLRILDMIKEENYLELH